MSLKSVLDKIGADAKSVFAFLGSTKGQTIIASGEAVIESIDPALTGIFTLANSWLTEIVKAETLAAAAGTQTGTGTQKAAAVLAAVTPEVLTFAQSNGLTPLTAAQLATANDALVTFLNSFTTAPATAPAAIPPVPAA